MNIRDLYQKYINGKWNTDYTDSLKRKVKNSGLSRLRQLTDYNLINKKDSWYSYG